MPKTIFVVDDSDTNLMMAEKALEQKYRVMTLPSAAKMFALLEKLTADLIFGYQNRRAAHGYCCCPAEIGET